MRCTWHAAVGLVVVLAANTTDTSCQPTAKACEVDTRGIRVEHGEVTDVITVICDPQPRTHRLDGWLEFRTEPGVKWQVAGVKRTSRTPPDAEGFALAVSAGHCIPGDYRTAWQATGIGPDPMGRAFNYSDGDAWGTPVDCEE